MSLSSRAARGEAAVSHCHWLESLGGVRVQSPGNQQHRNRRTQQTLQKGPHQRNAYVSEAPYVSSAANSDTNCLQIMHIICREVLLQDGNYIPSKTFIVLVCFREFSASSGHTRRERIKFTTNILMPGSFSQTVTPVFVCVWKGKNKFSLGQCIENTHNGYSAFDSEPSCIKSSPKSQLKRFKFEFYNWITHPK